MIKGSLIKVKGEKALNNIQILIIIVFIFIYISMYLAYLPEQLHYQLFHKMSTNIVLKLRKYKIFAG